MKCTFLVPTIFVPKIFGIIFFYFKFILLKIFRVAKKKKYQMYHSFEMYRKKSTFFLTKNFGF